MSKQTSRWTLPSIGMPSRNQFLWGTLFFLTLVGIVSAYAASLSSTLYYGTDGKECPPDGTNGCQPISLNINNIAVQGCNQPSEILEMVSQVINWQGIDQIINGNVETRGFTGLLSNGIQFTINQFSSMGTGFAINVEDLQANCQYRSEL